MLNRFTSRVNLDYFVSDRIKIETNIALTYTKNKKNNGDLLSIAYVRMPNLSVYEQDRNGNDLEDYYSMLPTVSSQLRDQLDHKNPVALAHLASNDETSYNITPEFKLRYNLLGLEEDKTRLAYEGKVVFNIFNRYEDQFMPLSLSTRGWNDTNNRESNRTTASSSKSLGVTTTHTLTFTPAFKNKDHVLTMMLRGQLTSGTSSDQRTVSGYSGRAVRPIALRHVLEMAQMPQKPVLSGIGGIETWRDALEFIQLGCSNVQVCTAVMQYGYRIIDDLILGLQRYMVKCGVTHLQELVGEQLPSFTKPSHLNRTTIVYPKFNAEQCVGCGRCAISCSDGGHQAIVFDHATRRPQLVGSKCVGCHLCRLVCPTGAIGISKRVPRKA